MVVWFERELVKKIYFVSFAVDFQQEKNRRNTLCFYSSLGYRSSNTLVVVSQMPGKKVFFLKIYA
jgi:hypothetical protein